MKICCAKKNGNSEAVCQSTRRNILYCAFPVNLFKFAKQKDKCIFSIRFSNIKR